MRDWDEIVFGKVIGRIYVQKKAHALTLLSVVWVIMSLVAFLICKGSTDLIGWIIASFVWALHVSFILGAIWFWRHEKKDTEVLIRESGD
jgi:predicted MFS family arabinose efflux permease